MTIRILDLTPTGHYADGSPSYKFSCGYPTRGVRKVGPIFDKPEDAADEGKRVINEYLARDPYGNMGGCLGVTAQDGGFRAVIVTYHSNT